MGLSRSILRTCSRQCRRHWKSATFTAVVGGAGVRALGVFSSPRASAQSGSPESPRSLRSLWEERKNRRMNDIFIFLNVLIFVLDLFARSRLKVMGVKYNPSILNGEWWRLFTCSFLHDGLLHIVMNFYALDRMSAIEGALGRPLYTLIYLASVLSGALASYFFVVAPSLGASGCVFGIFSACWMFFENNKPYLSQGALQVQRSISEAMAINFIAGFVITRVDNWGHGGGFLCGLILAYLFGPRLIEAKPKTLVNQPRIEVPFLSSHQVQSV